MVSIDHDQVRRFAQFMRASADIVNFDFCHTGDLPIYPPAGAAGIADYFFFNAGHQFGFWRLRDNRYDRPMISTLDGRALKGSDYVSSCMTRAWRRDPAFFTPDAMRRRTENEWSALFADDSGINPLPQWDEHLSIIRSYVGWFNDHRTTPDKIVAESNGANRPLERFLSLAVEVPGYAEDPLRKKLLLLAIMLENRPEHFLRVTDADSYEPIIDYHLQRSALRTGLVRVDDPALCSKLLAREAVLPEEETLIRRATFDAVRELVSESGRSVAAVDYFFFMNRKRCPEMTAPECDVCPVNAICAHETELFQPVFRTTAY